MALSRHKGRELAVQMVYQMDLDQQGWADTASLERFWVGKQPKLQENRPFFELLVKGISSYLPQIDEAINSALDNWRLERVEKVDLAILRVAVYEMLYSTDIEKPDWPVSVDEAVEIAKKFGSKESPRFVNGILDAVAKKHCS